MKLSDIKQLDKILVVTAERIGDAIFITPGLRLLQQYLPETHIDVLAMAPIAGNVFQNNPIIHRLFVTNNHSEITRIASEYPVVVNLMYEMDKYVNHLTDIPVFNIPKPDMTEHRAVEVLNFIHSLFNESKSFEALPYELYPSEDDNEALQELLAQEGLDPSKQILIGMQLGCHRVARRGWKFWDKNRHKHRKVWPIECYVELAKKLCEQNPNVRIILTGSEQEQFLAKKFIKDCPEVVSLIGKTSLFQLTCLMNQLALYITHDTGSLHIACERQIPLVSLFGPIPVAFTGPYPKQDQFTIIARDTIEDIQVGDVLQAVQEKVQL